VRKLYQGLHMTVNHPCLLTLTSSSKEIRWLVRVGMFSQNECSVREKHISGIMSENPKGGKPPPPQPTLMTNWIQYKNIPYSTFDDLFACSIFIVLFVGSILSFQTNSHSLRVAASKLITQSILSCFPIITLLL